VKKEKKFNWVLASVEQVSAPNPADRKINEALFRATIGSRELPALSVTLSFWGVSCGLPGGKYAQAEALVLSMIAQPISIEMLSRVCLATATKEHSAEALDLIR